MTIKSLANFGWILLSFWSMASSAVVVDQPISVLSRMDRSKLVELAFAKGWMPAQCSKELDFYNLPVSSVPSYLRQGIFVSQEWSFPCLSAITKNPTAQSPERNYLTLLFTKLACAAVPENSVYFPELLLCKDAQWPNGCLTQDNPGKCLEQFNLTLEKNVQWLRKYSPVVFATLTGRSTVVKLSPPAIGPQLPPRLIDPAYFEPTKPFIQPTNIEVQSFQQRLTLVEELIAAPRVSGSKAVPVAVESEVKPEKVDLSQEQIPQPAPKAPKVTVTIKGSVQKPATVSVQKPVKVKPLSAKELRLKKYLEPIPDWAKKVHASAIRALTAPGFIRQPGYCSAWVREVFQSAFPKQAMPLDYYYFGPSAAGLSRRGVLRGST